MKITYTDFACKLCGSKAIVKRGQFKGVQYWWCKSCQRRFADNDALPEMKTPTEQVATALSLYYEGVSLNGIRRHLDQTHDNLPSKSTIWEWITRFSKEATDKASMYKPIVGDEWVADETVLDIGGRKVWFWDIMDSETRFLLASHLSTTRTTRDAQTLMERASKVAGKSPKVVITDSLAAYLDGVELAFGADTRHIKSKGFKVQPNTNLIERLHGTLKDRTKVMRGLKKDIKTARLFTISWGTYYDYLRPHEALNDKTPAEAAGIKFPYNNWKDIVAKDTVPASASSPKPVDETMFERIERMEPAYTESGFRIASSRARVWKKRTIRTTRSQSRPRLSIIRG